jgi:hypothetical protein
MIVKIVFQDAELDINKIGGTNLQYAVLKLNLEILKTTVRVQSKQR